MAPPSGRFGALALPLRSLTGTLEENEQFETLSAGTLTISFTSRRMGVGVDGEVRDLASPLEFAVQRQAVRVRVPRDAKP